MQTLKCGKCINIMCNLLFVFTRWSALANKNLICTVYVNM